MRNSLRLYCTLLLSFPLVLLAQIDNVFQPFTYEWPAATEMRLASGAPGPAYWQQQADYHIAVEIDDENQSLSGTVEISYTNNSPHTLDYLWVQLD